MRTLRDINRMADDTGSTNWKLVLIITGCLLGALILLILLKNLRKRE